MPSDLSNAFRGAVVTAAIVLALAAPTLAGERVNKDANDVAIRGYDPVAYFSEGRPVEGSPDFEHLWHDATWRFSSADNRELFAGDPARYAPRYGGFCAGGMALGRRLPIDPEAWVIVDGKLYLNYAKDGVDDFEADADNQIAKADANWERLGRVE
jgi:hypothetical protein